MQGGTDYRAINAALRAHFGLTLEQLEWRFQQDLRQERLTPELVEDVRLSVTFYETVRRYQQSLDPSAYFLTSWVPDGEKMRQRGIVADMLRRPSMAENLALEVMLVEAGARLGAADFDGARQLLDATDLVLDELTSQRLASFAAHPLAADYMALVQAAQAAGYQAQRIQVDDKTARVWATTTGPELVELDFVSRQGNWILDLEASSSLLNLWSSRAAIGPVSFASAHTP
jgi:hypothetical protein